MLSFERVCRLTGNEGQPVGMLLPELRQAILRRVSVVDFEPIGASCHTADVEVWTADLGA